jgi:hypothetical protein
MWGQVTKYVSIIIIMRQKCANAQNLTGDINATS